MNILFFLKPKESVLYLLDTYTLRQALEKMEPLKYSSVPIIDKDGYYVGCLSEGDILWYLKQKGYFDLKEAEHVSIKEIERHRDNPSININQDMLTLVNMSKDANFIPVVDDRKMFIGIVTRHDILNYYYDHYEKKTN